MRRWDQILDIRNALLKSSIDSFAQHGGKMAEFVTAWPDPIGKTYRQVSKNMLEAGRDLATTSTPAGGGARSGGRAVQSCAG